MVEAQEQFLASVEGPKGAAEIFEITLATTGLIEVEYKVVFEANEARFPSMGEAHLKANELVGIQDQPEN